MMKNISVLTMAYIGDSIYELYIRKMLINKGYQKGSVLQKAAEKYVSARAQGDFLNKIIDSDILNATEIEIVKRARNHKTNHCPRNIDIITYKHATALEALIGYLYLEKNYERLEIVMKIILEESYVCIW